MSVDRFGRTVTDNGDGTYSVPGITVGVVNIDAAIRVFDSMVPPNWIEPTVQKPLDQLGVFATLNVVLGLWSLEDAVNATGLIPDDLIAEAQAWAVVEGDFDAN